MPQLLAVADGGGAGMGQVGQRGADRRRSPDELRAAMAAEQKALQSDIAGPAAAQDARAARNSADGLRLRPLRHRRRIGRRPRRAQGGGDRRARRHRRGRPGRRHLRHPRLRAEEAARLRLAVSAKRSRTAPPTAGASAPAEFDWPTLIANKDKEIARLEGVYRANLAKAGAELIETPRDARRRPPHPARARAAASSPPSTS